LLGFLQTPPSINLIEAAILFGAETKNVPANSHKKIIAERRTDLTERQQTLIYRKPDSSVFL